MHDQEPVTHPSPQPGSTAVSNLQNIFMFSQGNPPLEYFKHTHLKCHPCSSSDTGGVILDKKEESVKHPSLCQALFPRGGLGLSTGRASALGMDTTKGGFFKESPIFTPIQFKIWLETHSKRAPFAACLHLSESQLEMD